MRRYPLDYQVSEYYKNENVQRRSVFKNVVLSILKVKRNEHNKFSLKKILRKCRNLKRFEKNDLIKQMIIVSKGTFEQEQIDFKFERIMEMLSRVERLNSTNTRMIIAHDQTV